MTLIGSVIIRRMTDDKANAANWILIGHESAVNSLRRGLFHGRSRHAYLFVGGESLGKMTLARTFAKALNCRADAVDARPCGACESCRRIAGDADPDILMAAADDSGWLKIEPLREVMRLLSLKPYAARYRIAILDDFDRVQPRAQDALLKTLEEPPPHAVLILLSRKLESVLPTIRSRAQIIPLRPLPTATIAAALTRRGIEKERAQLLAGLSGGRIGWALSAAADESLLQKRAQALDLLLEITAGDQLARMRLSERIDRAAGKDKQGLRATLEIWQTFWRDVLLQCCDAPLEAGNSDRRDEIRALALRINTSGALCALNATKACLRALETNANPRLALDVTLLAYPGLD